MSKDEKFLMIFHCRYDSYYVLPRYKLLWTMNVSPYTIQNLYFTKNIPHVRIIYLWHFASTVSVWHASNLFLRTEDFVFREVGIWAVKETVQQPLRLTQTLRPNLPTNYYGRVMKLTSYSGTDYSELYTYIYR